MKILFLFLLATLCLAPCFSGVRVDAGQQTYLFDRNEGLKVSMDGGKTWLARNAGLPHKIVYPFNTQELRPLTAFSFSTADPQRIAVTTKSSLHVSMDGGQNWRQIRLALPVKKVDTLSAVGLSPFDVDVIYLGTAFNGLYVSQDAGESWISLKNSLEPLYRGAGFYEEIQGIAVSPQRQGHLFLVPGFGAPVLQSKDAGYTWESLKPQTPQFSLPLFVGFTSEKDGAVWRFRIANESVSWYYQNESENWQLEIDDFSALTLTQNSSEGVESPCAIERAARINVAEAHRNGIYLNSRNASGDKLAEHLTFLKQNSLDTLIVDVKDDAGIVAYPSSQDFPKALNAVRERLDLQEIVSEADKKGVYLVGRIVVFQDPRLYAYAENAYAVWNKEDNRPWANLIPAGEDDEGNALYEQREFWVDPYSEVVWDYNVSIAKEVAAAGFDEIQFDYIRFPSDGNLATARYRNRREGMTRSDALESFLRYARQNLDVPISVDLYGFNSWYHMGNWIGQDIDMIADYVDVVCPMYYPSHFPRSFLPDLSFFDRAWEIYKTGTQRARSIVAGRSLIRPYVQSFLIGGEREFEEEEYGKYLIRQLEGLVAGKASGFSLWNASNNYYMVTRSLAPYTEEKY